MQNNDFEFIHRDNKILARKKADIISPLFYYHYTKKEIDQSEFSAGERFHNNYLLGWHGRSDYSPKEKTNGGKYVDIAETMASAKEDYARARKIVDAMGSEAAEVAEKVLLKEMKIFQAYGHWYTRKKAKVILHLVLDNLAKHYGYKSY